MAEVPSFEEWWAAYPNPADLIAALLRGPVREALKNNTYNSEEDEKEAHLNELRRIVRAMTATR